MRAHEAPRVTSGNRTRRKRGVSASRVRLYGALADTGLKTQAALAERIADLEGLDTAPKDIVNRVFRELPVELHTLERVARGLGVEAWTLYKSSGDQHISPAAGAGDPSPAAAPPPWHASRDRRLAGAIAAIAIAALLLGAWWVSPLGPQRAGDARPGVTSIAMPALGLGRPTAVVLPIGGDPDGHLAAALRVELEESFNVASSAAALVIPSGAAQAASLLRTDLSVDGEIVPAHRFTGVRLYVYAGGLRQQVWAESLPAARFERSIEALATRAATAIRHAAGVAKAGDEAPGHFPLAPVQDDYLEGRLHLDRPTSELSIKRAQARFAAALRADANYAHAHAGLCEALLEEHWMEDEERALQDAALACGRALQLRPDDAVVQIAHGHFLRLTGRIPEAIALFEQIIARQADEVFALEGLAITHFHAFRQDGDRDALAAAIDAAERAANADPRAWKILSRLAQMRFLAGELADAVAAIEAALERDENEQLLANAGTFQFCAGEVEIARDYYLRAREVAPDSYVGEEFLGMLLYFLGDFDESAALRRRAIDRVAASHEPEIHQMWGNLADSYRQSGRDEAALEAYRRAVEIAERDFLRGTATASDRVYRAYYYTMIRALEPAMDAEPLVAVLDADIRAELIAAEEGAVEPASYLRLAQAWMEHGDLIRAREARDRAVDSCAGYAELPDLAALSLAETVH